MFDFGFTFSEGAIGQDVIDDFQVGSDRIVINLWGLEFGVTLTLEERPRGSSALVTATGDEILLRGVSVTEFSVADLQI